MADDDELDDEGTPEGEDDLPMGSAYAYFFGSGPSLDNCWFIGQRYDMEYGFSPSECESWALQTRRGPKGIDVGLGFGAAAWFTGLWTSPSGTVYVADADGVVHVRPPQAPHMLASSGWQHHNVDVATMGVAGVDDDFVVAWGGADAKARLYVQTRGRWSEMPAPAGNTMAMHGKSRDLLYAVGEGGMIARWDGSSWQRQMTPTREALTGIYVVDEDHVWACGQGGSLLEGSRHGWAIRAELSTAMQQVAVWRGEVYVAALEHGLRRLRGKSNVLELVETPREIDAAQLDTRGDLLVTTPTVLLASSDGVKFEVAGEFALEDERGGTPKLWLA